MKLFLCFFIIFFASCANKKYVAAEDALDAAREYKDACLKGDFDKANFYVLPTAQSQLEFNNLKSLFFSKANNEIKESKEASIIIISSTEISDSLSQIVLSNSFSKITDTINVIKQNKIWLVAIK